MDTAVNRTDHLARWTAIGITLVAGTMAYNLVEAFLALYAAWAASSIALLGFGLDSVIEMGAATVLFWRLRVEASGASAARVAEVEERVHKFVGGTMIVLAVYVALQGGWVLYQGGGPEESLLGIIIAGASLVVMPLVSWGKLRAAAEINSPALRAEAMCTLACAYLSFTLLLGLAANALFGWWWADPVVALLMVPWLIKEGREGLQGGCGCGDDSCEADEQAKEASSCCGHDDGCCG